MFLPMPLSQFLNPRMEFYYDSLAHPPRHGEWF